MKAALRQAQGSIQAERTALRFCIFLIRQAAGLTGEE
jgi:hypothetical protein